MLEPETEQKPPAFNLFSDDELLAANPPEFFQAPTQTAETVDSEVPKAEVKEHSFTIDASFNSRKAFRRIVNHDSDGGAWVIM